LFDTGTEIPLTADMNTLNITQVAEKVNFVSTKIEKKNKTELSFSSLLLAQNLRTARRQAENSKLLASRLKIANENESDVYQLVLSDLLELEADDKANGVLLNYNDSKGREYSCAIGTQFAYSRLSDTYQRKQTSRQRKRLYEAFVEKLEFIENNKYEVCFFTPTYPNLLGVGFEQNAEFHSRVWELFLRNSLVRKMFAGGYSRTDFTLGKKDRLETGASFDINIHGLNFHNHALVILQKALEFGDSHQLENKLQAIKEGKITVSNAEKLLLYKSLHIVKKWSDCLRIAHREVFKKCLKIKTNSGNAKVDFQKVDLAEIRNHSNEKRKGILFEVCGYTAKQADFKGLSPELLSEAEEVFRHKRILVPFGCFKQSKPKAESDNAPKSEVNNIADPLLKQHTYRNELDPKSEAKFLCYQTLTDTRKSLKKVGLEMCENGKRKEWLIHIGKIKNYLLTTHRNNLLKRFPDAIFTDLSGEKYYGRNISPLLKGNPLESYCSKRKATAETRRYSLTKEQPSERSSGLDVIVH
jgi:hypothetical protein